jgi:hypothetical protein
MAKRVFIKTLQAFQGQKCAVCDSVFAHYEKLNVYDEEGRKLYYCNSCHEKEQAQGTS